MFNKLKDQAKELKDKAQEKYNKITKKQEKQEKPAPFVEMEEEEKQPEIIVENKNTKLDEPVSNIDPMNTPKKDTTFTVLKNNFSAAGGYLQNKVSEAQLSVKTSFQKADQSIKQSILRNKLSLNKWIAAKVDQRITKSLKSMEPKIIKSVDKSVPWNCCKEFVNDALLSLWKDVSELIRFELRVSIDQPQLELSRRPDTNRYLKCWYKFRNWILYNLQPFDLDYGQQLKRWSFIFLKLLQTVPYYGVQAMTFFMIFLAIDKSEEYQVVNFILDYKNMQFFTAGCLAAILGFLEYFYCATLLPAQNLEDIHNYCFSTWRSTHLIIQLISYFSQIILIWCAFAVLHRTKSRADFINVNPESQKRGGRLKYFMIYDLVCFILTGGLVYLCYHFYFENANVVKIMNDSGSLVYFAKVIYGLSSLPFVIFIVPFFVRMFTTAVPTGYDEYGNVVPMISKMKITYQELPIENEEIDIEEVLI